MGKERICECIPSKLSIVDQKCDSMDDYDDDDADGDMIPMCQLCFTGDTKL